VFILLLIQRKKRDYFKQIESSDRDQKMTKVQKDSGAAWQVFLGDKTASREFMR